MPEEGVESVESSFSLIPQEVLEHEWHFGVVLASFLPLF